MGLTIEGVEMVEPVAVEVEELHQAAVILVVGAQMPRVDVCEVALVRGNRPCAAGSFLRLRAE